MARSVARPEPSRARRVLTPLLTIVALLALWQAVVAVGLVPNFLLPTPVQVVQALAEDAALLASHCVTTLAEAAAGLAAGVALGFVFAVLMDRFESFYLAFEPLMTISQTIPTVAIAPLLVLWLGYGALPKIVLVIISTFFPITVSLASGFRSVDPDVVDLMRTMNASRWQIFWYAKLPAAADQFFSGLKISATYAIVGAVIAEWLGGNEGLGVYMTRVRKSFSYDRMFAAIIVISALSLGLMKLVELAQRVLMPWKRVERNNNER
ncbi:ABC transporter permease [Olsenella sp. An293]|uniref:ABC transporter permease n=1 Tax=Olsenella sp. An293 TaxID=1965626 RepID=UPI000B38ECB8|nr:ABC transporter permease [Olsenella sp. An293]OUO32396.1 nitrate ABC transporter permease [Olsenella sp. An293]